MSFGNVPRDSSVRNSSANNGTVAGKATFSEMFTAGKVIFGNLDANPSPAGSLVVDNFGQLGLGPAGGFLQLRYRGPSLQANRDDSFGWITVPTVTPVIAPQSQVLVGSDQKLPIDIKGLSLSYDGNYLSTAGVSTNNSLRVWNFERVAGIWSEIGAGIRISSAASTLQINSMTMSSDALTIAIGIDVLANNSPGSIYIYTRQPETNTWTQQGPVLIGSTPTSNLGFSLSLTANGNFLAAGAPQESSLDGAVYIYRRIFGVWSLLTKLLQTVPNYLPQSAFGLVNAIVQNPSSGIVTVAVGSANFAPDVGTGATWLFTNATGSFVGQIVFGTGSTTGPFTQFGGSVCLSGDGATAYSSAIGINAVATYKYSLTLPNSWIQTGVILPGNGYTPITGSPFGISNSVSADNTVLAIGALAQAVFVYNVNGIEDGASRKPIVPGNFFALKMVVSGNGDTMASSSTTGISIFVTK